MQVDLNVDGVIGFANQFTTLGLGSASTAQPTERAFSCRISQWSTDDSIPPAPLAGRDVQVRRYADRCSADALQCTRSLAAWAVWVSGKSDRVDRTHARTHARSLTSRPRQITATSTSDLINQLTDNHMFESFDEDRCQPPPVL